MKHACLLLLVLIITKAQAQQVHVQGNITDAQSGQPVAGATISVQAKNYFFPADNAGKFNLSTDKIAATDSVAFSCIGYRTKRVIAGDLKGDAVIQLTPVVNMLREVTVGTNPRILGSKAKSDDLLSSFYPGFEAAMFMNGADKTKGIIKTVSFYLGNGHALTANNGGDVTAPFKIKLYEVDTAGKPGNELSKEVIVVSAKKNNSWFVVDVSAYHINNPDGGFFVAFCLLDSGYYRVKKGYENANGIIASGAYIITPRLGTTVHEFKETRSYIGSGGYWGWQWTKDPFNYSYMIRATIAEE